MNNVQIAAAFDEVADILEFQGANQFRVRAYRNAARTVHDLPESIQSILCNPDRKLTEISSIGADLAVKIATLCKTGTFPLNDELRSQVPQSVLALLRIQGLGPKKAAALHKELKIQSLDQLREACLAHRVQELKGFGQKTEEMILAGLDLASTAHDRMLWAEADEMAQELLTHLRGTAHVDQLEAAGS